MSALEDITISDNDYYEILASIGYPIVTEEDLKITADNVKNLFIVPAMRDYFSYFPIAEEEEVNASKTFEADFPDNAFGVSSVQISLARAGALSATASPFVNSRLIVNAGGHSSMSGRWTGSRYSDFNDAGWLNRAVTNTYVRLLKNPDFTLDYENGKLHGKVTTKLDLPHIITIKWAKFSTDFNDIPFRRKNQVIDLSKSNLMNYVYSIRQQIPAQGDEEIESDHLSDEAERLRKAVMESWEESTKVVVLRG